MLFRQFVDEDLGCASYLVGDADAGEALLIDPAYAIEPYLTAAEQAGVRIVRVLETHTHADHVSGHGRLALEHDVPVSIHRDAVAAFPHDPLADGDALTAGSVTARTIHTPGHRPEHCCFLVGGTLFTGDSLFVGTVARPDLAVEAREGAEDMFRSLHRLLELADDVQIFPGHVAGSLCGTGMSPAPSTTIGAERRGNPLLAIPTVAEFIDETAEDATPRPPNMDRIVELNGGPFLGDSAAPGPVRSPDDATVLDVRSADDFAAGHVPGALNVPVAVKGFGTRSCFVLRRDEQVVLHASTPVEADLAARRLRAVGLLDLQGYLDGPQELEPLGTVELDDLGALLRGGEVDVIDVRELDERDSGFIPGSKHIPYRLLRAYGAAVAGDKPVVTICESGARAAVAASVLVAAGVDARPVLHGGIADWHRAGGHTVEFRRCGG